MLSEFLTANNIVISSVFIPFSRSRNAGENVASLNWSVTIHVNGRAILTTDYMAGQGHCPAYKRGNRDKHLQRQAIAWECEHGKRCRELASSGHILGTKESITPDVENVIECLMMDAEALNAECFQDWAENFGYSIDSIKAKKTYDACVATALKLRNGLGYELFEKLRKAIEQHNNPEQPRNAQPPADHTDGIGEHDSNRNA